MLSQRRYSVLESVIQDYVQSAQPVGSNTLVRCYLPLVSAATVRNELMWLESQGYVVSPHTSAGRIPTSAGYRAFVNNLLLHAGALQQRVPLAADFGQLDSPPSLAAIKRLTNHRQRIERLNQALAAFAAYTDGLLVFWLPQIFATVLHRGLPRLLSQPEFSDARLALPLMRLLESQDELLRILAQVAQNSGLHIRIGGENSDFELDRFSLLAARFDAGSFCNLPAADPAFRTGASGNYGVVALFGSMRMDYPKAISTVCTIIDEAEG